MPRRPRPRPPVPSYDTVLTNFRRIFGALPAHDLLERAQKAEATVRRWKASKRPPEPEHLISAFLQVRAYRKLAREAAARRVA